MQPTKSVNRCSAAPDRDLMAWIGEVCSCDLPVQVRAECGQLLGEGMAVADSC